MKEGVGWDQIKPNWGERRHKLHFSHQHPTINVQTPHIYLDFTTMQCNTQTLMPSETTTGVSILFLIPVAMFYLAFTFFSGIEVPDNDEAARRLKIKAILILFWLYIGFVCDCSYSFTASDKICSTGLIGSTSFVMYDGIKQTEYFHPSFCVSIKVNNLLETIFFCL